MDWEGTGLLCSGLGLDKATCDMVSPGLWAKDLALLLTCVGQVINCPLTAIFWQAQQQGSLGTLGQGGICYFQR